MIDDNLSIMLTVDNSPGTEDVVYKVCFVPVDRCRCGRHFWRSQKGMGGGEVRGLNIIEKYLHYDI